MVHISDEGLESHTMFRVEQNVMLDIIDLGLFSITMLHFYMLERKRKAEIILLKKFHSISRYLNMQEYYLED